MRLRRAVVGSLGPVVGGTIPSHFLSTSGLGAKAFSRYLPTKSDLINAAPGSSAGNELSAKDWGTADQGPWVLAPTVCNVKEGVPGMLLLLPTPSHSNSLMFLLLGVVGICDSKKVVCRIDFDFIPPPGY